MILRLLKFTIIGLFCGFAGMGGTPVLAAVSLSATPAAGGTSLRFGRVDVKESSSQEVRLRITSSDNAQYQVFQRMVDPLVNERGESLDFEALQSYTVSGSNSQGSLYNQDPWGVSLSDNLVYSSDAGGTGDAFTMIYQMNRERINTTGSFTGRIAYTLRPLGGSSQSEVVLTVYLDIPDEFTVTGKASAGLDVIRLQPEDEARGSGYYQIRFDNNTGRTISVYQDLTQPLQNEQFEELSRDVLQMKTSASGGSENFFGEFAAMPLGRKLMFRSTRDQEDLLLEYRLDGDAASRQKAGIYRSELNYILETENADPQYLSAHLEVEVPPVFKMEMEFPNGPIHFSQILPNSPPQLQEVRVNVKSNLGRPYMVSQNISTPLTNDQGDIMDAELFTIKTEVDAGEGKNVHPEFTAAPVGDAPVYVSDADGSPAQFRIIYRLSPNARIKAGDYSTGIVLSLGEI